MTEPHSDRNGPGPLEALPGLARVAAAAWWHTAEWAVRTSVKTGWRVAGAVLRASGLEDGGGAVTDVAGKVSDAAADNNKAQRPGEESQNGRLRDQHELLTLREQGELLLRHSRDVHYEVQAHPAYERILSELVPDEARILRLLLLDGPQPSVDVRTGGPLGMVRSRLLAPGLSMIGARAGCRYVDRVPAYLNNLFRLGLIWFSRETLPDPMRYQVLEAQPDVLAAIHSVAHAKVVRRSIHLTPFGEDFCRVCLCPETTVWGDLPEHSAPLGPTTAPQPPVAPVD